MINTNTNENPDEKVDNITKQIENKDDLIKLDTDKKVNTKQQKIQVPKRKFAIIHGYNGHDYCGNQKNPDVRTVEDEMEKALFKLNFISECNYGFLQKIQWMRASRTDKKVSAIMNVVSCKLHRFPDKNEEDMKKMINENLPSDIKVFRIIEVSRTFNSKDSNNNREYHYILPAFALEPKELSKESSRIHSIDKYVGNYEYKITPEFHEKIVAVCKAFRGTKKYHNYTKKLPFSDPSSSRHIYEISCQELINYKEFQAIKFKIVGQSFLYNQIRKMIGCIIDICRENRDFSFLENTFLSNKIEIPKAPAEGLYLHKIDYSRYNERKITKKNPIFLTEQDEKEMEDFRLELVNHIETTEIKDRVFSKWCWKLDNQRENTY